MTTGSDGTHGRTLRRHVWAAGTARAFPYRGGRIRLESVPTHRCRAELVAENNQWVREKEYVGKAVVLVRPYDVNCRSQG